MYACWALPIPFHPAGNTSVLIPKGNDYYALRTSPYRAFSLTELRKKHFLLSFRPKLSKIIQKIIMSTDLPN